MGQWQTTTATSSRKLPVGKKPPKHAKWAQDPQPTKQPKWKDPVIEGQPLAWRFSVCDKGGPFGWPALTDPKFKEVHDKLHEFETKNWPELHAGGSHPIATDRLEKPARDRLGAIGQDDIDELMSFRLTGTNRIWCIHDRNIMRVLWWDPDHQVYIVPKDRGDREKRNRRK